MADRLRLLPPFRWRGRLYPVTSRSVSFAHDNAKHKIQYRKGVPIEPLGPQNLVFSYTFPMRDSIATGPYEDLFVAGLPLLLADCLNREAGPLEDPIYGPFNCVPNTYNDDTDVQRRDGTDIRVEFEHQPEEDDDPVGQSNSVGSLTSEAGKLDQDVSAVDWEQIPSPEPASDILDAIAGVGDQIDRNITKLGAQLDDLAFKAQNVERSADRLENPRVWPIRASARRVRETALRLKKRGDNPAQRIITVTTRFQSTISVEAARSGQTVGELLRLNPGLAKLPFIPAGTPILAPARR